MDSPQTDSLQTASAASSPIKTDVIIIGAGPCGLTAALTLQHHGVNFIILDRNPGPVQHSNALGVAVRTLEVLEMLGLKDTFAGAGYPMRHASMRAFGTYLGRIPIDTVDSPYRGMHAIPQNVTEKLLNDALLSRGGKILRNHEATSITQDDSGVTVIAKPGNGESQSFLARYLIGCEGSDSLTRRTLNIDFVGERYESQVFLQTDAVLRWTYPVGDMYGFLHQDMACIVFPYDLSGRHRVICALPDTNPEEKAPPTLAEMQEFVRRAADPRAELSAPTWFSRFRTQHRVAKTYRDGRCFLAGDAAHVHPPIGGQGMNTGMQDAFNVGWKLALVVKGQAPEPILNTYHSERHPVAEGLIHGVDRAFHALFGKNELWHAAVRALGPVAAGLTVVQHNAADMLAEVNVSYSESAIVADANSGKRAPDASLVNLKSLETTQLFSLYDGRRYTLLFFSGSGSSSGQVQAWQDFHSLLPKVPPYAERLRIAALAADPGQCPPFVTESEQIIPLADRSLQAHHKYSVGSAAHLVLVRPDGYTAFHDAASAAPALLAHLNSVFTI